MADLFTLLYLAAAVLFVLGIHGLRHPSTAFRGNTLAMGGMALAILTTLCHPDVMQYGWILAGVVLGAAIGLPLAYRVKTTQLPQLVALFNGFVGLAAAAVAIGTFLFEHSMALLSISSRVEIALSLLVGLLTFGGSVIAAGKLHGVVTSRSVFLPGKHIWTLLFIGLLLASATGFVVLDDWRLLLLTGIFALILGLALVFPIGGADMPVVVALFNAYSGWAAVATGFMLGNILLVLGGALVGASGTILTAVMCQAMNRSFLNVLLGGFGAGDGAEVAAPTADGTEKVIQQAGAEDAAFVLNNARRVVIVPGYGMAVAQAQHALKDLMQILESHGVEVIFAIHPVAGRMPGHMNVLLAEADVPYDNVQEMERVNPTFPQTDAVIVVGANDVVNPDAQNIPGSPLYGMPVLEVWKAGTVFVIKRSLRSGYAGVDNSLFTLENTRMVLGDARDVTEAMASALKSL